MNSHTPHYSPLVKIVVGTLAFAASQVPLIAGTIYNSKDDGTVLQRTNQNNRLDDKVRACREHIMNEYLSRIKAGKVIVLKGKGSITINPKSNGSVGITYTGAKVGTTPPSVDSITSTMLTTVCGAYSTSTSTLPTANPSYSPSSSTVETAVGTATNNTNNTSNKSTKTSTKSPQRQPPISHSTTSYSVEQPASQPSSEMNTPDGGISTTFPDTSASATPTPPPTKNSTKDVDNSHKSTSQTTSSSKHPQKTEKKAMSSVPEVDSSKTSVPPPAHTALKKPKAKSEPKQKKE